MLDVPKVDSQG